MTRELTVIIEREDDGYVALGPELDIASPGLAVNEARNNFEGGIGSVLRDRLHDRDREKVDHVNDIHPSIAENSVYRHTAERTCR